jgi:uncharacterized membrane protein
VGAAIYLAVLLEPSIRATSADLERQLLNKTSKLNSLWITSAAVLTMITGMALVSTTPGRSFSDLGSAGWGMMILIGLIASVAAFVVSGVAGAFTARLRRGLESGGATNEQLGSYRRGLSILGYVNAVLVVIAVATMASARYA